MMVGILNVGNVHGVKVFNTTSVLLIVFFFLILILH